MGCHMLRLALASASLYGAMSLSCHVGVRWIYTGEGCVLGSTGSITTQDCGSASAVSCVTESYSQSVQGGLCHLDYMAAACGTPSFNDCEAAETSFHLVDGGSDFSCVSCSGNDCNPFEHTEIKYSDAKKAAAGWTTAVLALMHAAS
mmetsp:Transcript_54178/g.100084  ORF Transcript_54178/g.100084 Transcript_54178/m.100084 type:complete len:147 (+) Transcript_54178:57-497(+)